MVFGINALSVKPGLTGGGETYLRELIAHLPLVDRDNQYRLFVSRRNQEYLDPDSPGFRSVVCPYAHQGRYTRVLMEQVWLPLAARRLGIDVLLYPTDRVPVLNCVPAVMTVQNLLPFHPEWWDQGGTLGRSMVAYLQNGFYRSGVFPSARRAAAVVAVSEETRHEILRACNIDPDRVIVVYHGVSDRFRFSVRSLAISDFFNRNGIEDPYFLSVGALSPYKNIRIAIEAMAYLRRSASRVPMLVVVGDDRYGCRAELEVLAAALGVSDLVKFLGIVPHPTLPAVYSGATASLLLSSCESFGLPLVEAMACGCPVICASRSSLPEIAGGAAILVDPEKPEHVAKAMKVLLDDAGVREAYSRLGLERASTFDWRVTAARIRDVLMAVAHDLPVTGVSAPNVMRAA